MIDINTLPAEGFKGQFYKLHFQRLGFLLFPPADLSLLKHFSKSTQNALGKLDVHCNLTSILKFPGFFKDVNYILITDYSQLLFLPFLTKILPHLSIIATNLSFQLGRISLQAFHETLTNFDATSEKLNFFQQSQLFDKYEEKMDASLSNWRKIYSAEDIKNCLSKVVKVNYYQVFNTERGVWLRCFPSGKNNGSCFWEIKNCQTNQKILLVNEMAQYNWKTCMSYNLQRIKQSRLEDPYSLVVFTKKTLDSFSENQELRISQNIRKINSNASLGISTTIVLQDNTLCIDLIPRISLQPEGQVLGIILNHECYHSFHNFINSYVDYLSKFYKNQIFSEAPDYPLIHYSKLRNKGFLVVGTLEQLAVKRKLPLKEIILQSHPFVRFIKDYDYYLEIDENAVINQQVKHKIEKISLGSNFSSYLLSEFMEAVGQTKYLCFSPNSLHLNCLDIGRHYNLAGNQQLPLHLLTRNYDTMHRFQSFILKDGQLELSPVKMECLYLPKNWAKVARRDLSARGITVTGQDQDTIKTESTTLKISQKWKLTAESSNREELFVLVKYLNGLAKKYELS